MKMLILEVSMKALSSETIRADAFKFGDNIPRRLCKFEKLYIVCCAPL